MSAYLSTPVMTKPNILFIMSDDHASNAISAYQSRLAEDAPTPNIDRIACNGMRLQNCHCTNAICTPSRAVILTGQHSHINGVKTLKDKLPDNAYTLPEILNDNGYQTAIFGKWHLHTTPRGFNQWAVLPEQGFYNDPVFTYNDKEHISKFAEPTSLEGLLSEDERVRAHGDYLLGPMAKAQGYVTDIITDMTLDWLENERKSEQPFFLCCHHKAPHDFFEYDHQYEEEYEGVEFEEPCTLFEDDETLNEISRRYGSTVSERWEPRNMVKHLMDPDYPNGGAVDFSGLDFEGKTKKAYQKYMQDYLRTVKSVDASVGKILDYIEASGLKENTIIVYTSDQGMMLGEHDKIDKRWIFDESQKMPFLIQYPKEIPQGTVNSDMVDNTDFAPTLLDYADVDIPKEMQGRSIRSLLKGNTPIDWRQSVYYRYWMHMAHHWVPAHYGIRTDKYKLIFFYGLKLDSNGCNHPDCDKPFQPGFELYDMENDPFEKRNVINDTNYQEVKNNLKKELFNLKYQFEDTDKDYPELLEIQKVQF